MVVVAETPTRSLKRPRTPKRGLLFYPKKFETMENNNQPSTGLPISPEDAKRAAEALTAYLGNGTGADVETVLKLIHLNNAIAKKAIEFAHTDEKLANQIKGDYINYANGLESIAIKLFSGYVFNLIDRDQAFNFD